MIDSGFIASNLIVQGLKLHFIVLLGLILPLLDSHKLFLEHLNLALEEFEFSVRIFKLELQDIGQVLCLGWLLNHVDRGLPRVLCLLSLCLEGSLQHEVQLIIDILCSQEILWHKSGMD